MKSLSYIFLSFLFMMVIATPLSGAEPLRMGYDGPYVMKLASGQFRFVGVGDYGEIYDSVSTMLNPQIKVVTHDGRYRFSFPLYSETALASPPKSYCEEPDSLFVLSDPHGDFNRVVGLLQRQQIIDTLLHWNWRANHLMIIGDVFDRGNDMTALIWLIYRLEREAEENGGKVHFLLGNHEEMVLRGSDRYMTDKYKDLARNLSISYNQLWSENNEPGRWLRNRNIIMTIGKNVFVHGGLSPEIKRSGLSFDAMNEKIRANLGTSRNNNSNDWDNLLRGGKGPLWFRGAVSSDRKHSPVTTKEMKQILNDYHVERMIVGHTIFDQITFLHDNRVIGVNMNDYNEKPALSGLLIENNNYWIIESTGLKRKVD